MSLHSMLLSPVSQMELETLNAIRKLLNSGRGADVYDIVRVLQHNGELSAPQQDLLQTEGRCKIPDRQVANGQYMYSRFISVFKNGINYDTAGFPKSVRHVVGEPDTEISSPAYSSIKAAKQSEYGLHSMRSKLRTAAFAQPRALRAGDVLATGERVIDQPRLDCNGECILVLLAEEGDVEEKGKFFGTWTPFPRRIAIALKPKQREAKNPQKTPPNYNNTHKRAGKNKKKTYKKHQKP